MNPLGIRFRLLAASPLALVLACGDCAGCGGGAVVAELRATAGSVQRDHADAQLRWDKATLGATFVLGDGVRTDTDATASLTVFPDTQLFVRPDSVVRFSQSAPEAPGRVKLETGEVQIETTAVALDIVTSEGVARLSQGSRTRVRAEGNRIHFDVQVGKVRVEADGQPQDFGAGEHFELHVGTVTREQQEAPEEVPKQVSQAPDVPDKPVEATVPEGPGWLLPPASPSGFRLPAGESATVHDPRSPTVVAISLATCQGPADVDVRGKGGRARGSRERVATLRLSPGTYRYRVACKQASGASKSLRGRLLVRRDAGTHRLPRNAPNVSVDADGRRYSVRYQNRLPRVSFSWPHAPTARHYILRLRSDSGQRTHRSDVPSVALPAASLPEGVYRFRFEAAGGRRSPEGVLNIAFDNTTRAAYLMSPRAGAALRSGPVPVAGVALRGSKVRVQSQPVSVAEDGRFKVTVPPLSRGTDLVVRVQHRRGGVHYYLRHTS